MQLYWGYSIQYCIQAQYFVLAGLEKPLAYTHELQQSWCWPCTVSDLMRSNGPTNSRAGHSKAIC